MVDKPKRVIKYSFVGDVPANQLPYRLQDHRRLEIFLCRKYKETGQEDLSILNKESSGFKPLFPEAASNKPMFGTKVQTTIQ